MRGLDTNVLLRYFTRDEPEQASVARKMIQDAEDHDERLFVSVIVLCEVIWVLRGRTYRYRREEMVHLLELLLQTPRFEVQHRREVYLALRDFAEGEADFSDYLIGRLGRDAGCRDTVTFDSRLATEDEFTGLG